MGVPAGVAAAVCPRQLDRVDHEDPGWSAVVGPYRGCPLLDIFGPGGRLPSLQRARLFVPFLQTSFLVLQGQSIRPGGLPTLLAIRPVQTVAAYNGSAPVGG